jgi:glycerate 2-kinase
VGARGRPSGVRLPRDGEASPDLDGRFEALATNVRRDPLRHMRRDALACLIGGLTSVNPESAIEESLRLAGPDLIVQGRPFSVGKSKIHLLAVGKASVPMARPVLRRVPIASGIVVTSDARSALADEPIPTIVASHPLPNEESLRAGAAALELAAHLHADELLLVLISGGASSLLEASSVPLDDLRACYEALLRSGLDIRRLNEVRKAISMVKGGRLGENAAARGASVISLILSDIVGDPISDIGSGPTAPSSSRGAGAEQILRKAKLWEEMPISIRRRLAELSKAPKAWHDRSGRVHAFIVAGNERACQAARLEAERRGYASRIWTTSMQGEARHVGPALVSRARRWNPRQPSIAVIAGGETTVTVRGEGKGGRNQELALSTVEIMDGQPAVLLSCGTDGADGNTDAAGAIVDGETMSKARALGLDPREFLEGNNSSAFFEVLNDRIVTGPTGTNVADLIVFLMRRSAPRGPDQVNRFARTRGTSGTRRSHPRGRPARRSERRR